MPANNGEDKAISRQDEAKTPDPLAALVQLGTDNAGMFDMSALTKEQQSSIVLDYQRGLIDVKLRAATLGVDVAALGKTLRDLVENTVAVSESEGSSVTITHTSDTALGRTEVIIGNTEQAHRGKLTKSQGGDRDWTPLYVMGGLILVGIVLLAVLTR